MKVVVMVDRSNGNDSVGDMWTDTYIFNGDITLEQVFEKISVNYRHNKTIKNNIRLQVGVNK